MHTLMLEVPEEVYASLLRTAEQTGQQLEELAVQWLAAATQHQSADPVEEFIGAFNSDNSEWADNHDHYLGDNLVDRLDGDNSKTGLDA